MEDVIKLANYDMEELQEKYEEEENNKDEGETK
jgi:hypothetical protein